MRILYLGSTDLPQTKARAIQIVHTCHALARAGADVTLAVGRRGRGGSSRALREYGLAPHPRLRLLRLPILRIPPTAPSRVLAQFTRVWQLSYLAGLAAALPFELAWRRPDIVFARDLRIARLAAGPAHAIGARLVFEVHGLPSYEVTHGAGRANLPRTEIARLRALEDAVFERADQIVTITECARQILIDGYGVPAGRVRTVADGTTVADGVAPTPDPSPVRGRGEADSRPSIYYVGQLYPWKGAGLVIDVAARVPEANVVIVGGQTNWTRDDPEIAALADRARDLGVAERVELRGHVPYDRVPDALAAATVALLPLPDEPVARLFTSPLKLFDYMAAGVPIVASDLPALREVLRHEENALLARPGDPEAFADAVRRLLADNELAVRLGRQARADVAGYSWDARATALLDVLGASDSSDDSVARARSLAAR
ncbi:MAG TPA: glycosyltransferase family 4 protein [Chloroflexota bacterium]|nr:glycosyltransferase family 4 protein [Chloroflexota bacterium]